MRQLGEKIEADHPGPEGKRAVVWLLFSMEAGISAGTGYAAPDLDPLRKSWEQTRVDLFGEQLWYRSTTVDVIVDQKPALVAADPSSVYAMDRVIEKLEDLIRSGRSGVRRAWRATI